MKITQINGYQDPETGAVSVNLAVDFFSISVTEAISSVLALFAGERGMTEAQAFAAVLKEDREIFHHPKMADAIAAEANIIDEPAPKAEKATRTRRPRTNPDAAPARVVTGEVTEEVAAMVGIAPVEGRRRTRVTAEPAAPEVKTITDADLAKACSNAAAIVGIEVVQAVIADFHVTSMQELAADVREKFLGELDDEIRLAKEELAKAGQ